jgi:protein-disulfide isomerase
MSNTPETRSKAPMLIIGAVALIALVGGLWFYGSSKATPKTANSNTTASNSNSAAKGTTIPSNAPAGAQPPNEAGSPNASVTLEEFADFQCGSCAAADPTMSEIKSMYGSRIHFIFRNFPLQIPQHDKSFDAAVAAEAAGNQGKFWEMHHLLFSHQQDWTKAPTFREIWKGYAQNIGLNVPKWETDIAGITAKGRVNLDMDRGKAININSTPTLFINGTAVPFQSMNVDGLKALIDAEFQKGAPQGAAPANSETKPAANDTTK